MALVPIRHELGKPLAPGGKMCLCRACGLEGYPESPEPAPPWIRDVTCVICHSPAKWDGYGYRCTRCHTPFSRQHAEKAIGNDLARWL